MQAVLATSLGELTVVREEGGLTGIYFPRHWPKPDRTSFGPRVDAGFEEVARQLLISLGTWVRGRTRGTSEQRWAATRCAS